MASYGAAKENRAIAVKPKGEGGEPEGEASANYAKAVEKFHAIHHKMAGHLAEVQRHMNGLHDAHNMLGEHLGLEQTSMPGKSKTSMAAPTEADEAQE